jgi:hypothetical protein
MIIAHIQKLIYNDDLDLLVIMMSDGCVYVTRRVRIVREVSIIII